MSLVVDASVFVKWLLRSSRPEPGTELATRLVQRIVRGQDTALQPPHWLVEVGAVLARLSPSTAAEDILMLHALEIPVTDEPGILQRACQMAIDLRQHMFDTLYHAVALEIPDCVLVTADERYLRAARRMTRIQSLRDWRPT